MGNTCAQDCAEWRSSKDVEASFDVNGEHSSTPAYTKVSVLASQANPQDLPRLGLGAPGSTSSQKFSPLFGGRSDDVSSPVDHRQDHRSSGKVTITETAERPNVGNPIRDPVSESMVAQNTLPLGNVPSLQVVFDVNGWERQVQILRRPLGAEFAKHGSGPCKIEKIRPQSHAAEIGMEVGWSVKSIGGQDVARKSFEEMQGVLKNGMTALPMEVAASLGSNSGLELVFDIDGWEKRVQLHRRPLGAEFAKRSRGPTRIDRIRPESYAAELGMEVGWIIKCIGGEDVTKKTFGQTQSALQNAMTTLPMTQ